MASKDSGTTTADATTAGSTAVAAVLADYPFTLVVAHPFGDHERGSAITDPEAIAAVLEGENASHVRKVNK